MANGPLGRAGHASDAPDSSRYLLWLIFARAGVLFLSLNLAQPLGILPRQFLSLPFLPVFNVLCVTLSLAYLGLWWNGWYPAFQMYLQVGVDLAIASALVAKTGAVESPFASFYLLIVIYCSLILGRRGAMISAALCTILYAGLVGIEHWSYGDAGAGPRLDTLTFRLSLNALGLISVALLGTYLSQRLQIVQELLVEKTDSLRQLQKLNDLIVSSIRSGLVTTDLDGEITLFNNTAAELTGRSRTEVMQRPMEAVFGPEIWSKIGEADLLHSSRPMRHESWIAVGETERRFLGFSVSPLNDHQRQTIGYIVSFQDLTEIKQLEEEIQLKDRLATIGRMAAGIAHEIRNPLTSMRGSVEILRSRTRLAQSDERLLDIMLRESDRLNQFVEDLLFFARPGKYPRQPTDIVPLLRDCVALLQNHPGVRDKHQVRLEVETESLTVLGNADKLRQVFWNLSQNGLRAMPDGGTLLISAGMGDRGGGRVAFQDEGIGIGPGEMDRLFQPFHSGFSGGTGLGLSVVFQILEDHRGKIHFESKKGKGTRVTVQLPAPAPEAGGGS